MIAQTFRGPHNLYRRYQASVESGLSALSLALLIGFTLNGFEVYPTNWVLVIATAVGLIGLRWPTIAVLIAFGSLVYPLFLINLYLAVIFLAIISLGHRLFVHYFGATVLILATPILATYHFHWLVPILAGLWWGGLAGAWVGGVASVWGKLLGGLAGLNMDWLILAGDRPTLAGLSDRFTDANSLETLLLIVEPFSGSPDVLLYNLLQIIGWALTAGLVGTMTRQQWVKYHTPWSILVVTAGGGLMLLGTHLGLPYWLSEAVSPDAQTVLDNPIEPFFALLMVVVIGTGVYTLRESLELPVAPKQMPRRNKPRRNFNLFKRQPKVRATANTSAVSPQMTVANSANIEINPNDPLTQPRQPVRVPDRSELPAWNPPRDDTGLIMLEID